MSGEQGVVPPARAAANIGGVNILYCAVVTRTVTRHYIRLLLVLTIIPTDIFWDKTCQFNSVIWMTLHFYTLYTLL